MTRPPTITALPRALVLSPIQMLAALRCLVVAAACVLDIRGGPTFYISTRVTIVVGALLGQQLFSYWLVWRTYSTNQLLARCIIDIFCIGIASAVLGHQADTFFLLYPLMVVEAALLLSPSKAVQLTGLIGIVYAISVIVSVMIQYRVWAGHDWIVAILEAVLLAVVAAVSIQVVTNWRAEQEHIIRLSLLDELSLLLADTRQLEDVLVRFVELVPQALRVQACVLALDEPGSDRRIWANLGTDTSALIDEALLSRRLNGQPLSHRFVHLPIGKSPYAAIYSLPLEIDDRAVGILSVARVTPELFDDRDRLIFQSLARHATQSLRNARLYQLESQAALQSRELEHFKSEMLASVSHEFRLPLTSISLAADTLLTAEFTADDVDVQRRLLSNIQRSVHRLSGFVQDVMDLARLEANQLELRQQYCDLGQIASVVIAHLEPQCEMKQQHLVLRNMTATGIVFGDAKRIEQVISNLLTNAHQYTPEGGEIILAIMPARLAHAEVPSHLIEGVALSVSDSGPGIPLAERSHIFDRFQRGDAGRRRSSGTGLGLHIARTVVQLHGGCLWVGDNALGGSTFWCILPLAQESLPMIESPDVVPFSDTVTDGQPFRHTAPSADTSSLTY